MSVVESNVEFSEAMVEGDVKLAQNALLEMEAKVVAAETQAKALPAQDNPWKDRKFSDDCRDAFAHAEARAKEQNHPEVTVEDLLVGLENAVKLGALPERVRRNANQLLWTEAAGEVLVSALKASDGREVVGLLHIVRGLVSQEAITLPELTKRGVSYADVVLAVARKWLIYSLLGFPGYVQPTDEISEEAYDELRENVTEAAKNSRTLFMAHLSLNAYAVLAIATLNDPDFYGAGAQIKLPLVDVMVSTRAFFVGMPILSLLVMLYFQLYLGRTWALVKKVRESWRPGFVPPTPDYRYPWIAFFSEVPGPGNLIARLGFSLLSWGATPALMALCWWKLAHYNSTVALWSLHGAPAASPFCHAFIVLLPLFALWAHHRGKYLGWGTGWGPFLRPVLVALLFGGIVSVISLAKALRPVELTNAQLSKRPNEDVGELPLGAKLPNIRLGNATLAGAYLAAANLDNSFLTKANFERANLDGAHLANAHLPEAKLGRASLVRAHLKDAYLAAANLSKANLTGAQLHEAHLDRARIIDGVLNNALLPRAILYYAVLERAKLRWAWLPAANLQNAVLRSGNLEHVRLQGANLSWANLVNANLSHADLRSANLRAANLQTANLTGANLVGALLESTKLSKSNLTRANLSRARLIGAELVGTSLNHASLRNALVRRTSFSGAELQEADLRRADLKGISLRGARLSGAELQGANLAHADLENADLRDASLSIVLFAGLTEALFPQLSDAEPTARSVQDNDGYFTTNLKYTNLRGADLRGADLRGADLSTANLEGANLEGALYAERGTGGEPVEETTFPDDFDPVERGMKLGNRGSGGSW